ncbi:MAG: hypothetical protein AAB427_16120 [Chloroflexota bacterium]
MRAMINELSFIAQASSHHMADSLIRGMIETIEKLQEFQVTEQLCSHSEFYKFELSPNYSIIEWAKSSSDQKTRGLFLRIATKGPYIDRLLDEALPYHACFYKEREVSSTSLAGAAYLSGVLISLRDAPDFAEQTIQVRFSSDGMLFQNFEIDNLTTAGQVSRRFRRRYLPSTKHDPIRGWSTPMNLSDEVAEDVLNRGVPRSTGKQIYGYYGGTFYEFQPDNAGSYHGYPVSKNEVPYQIIKKMEGRGII